MDIILYTKTIDCLKAAVWSALCFLSFERLMMMFTMADSESPLLKKARATNRSWMLYLAAPLIVFALLSIVFLIEGLWPFGGKSIAYADMAQGYVPRYYHLYDAMHGSKSIFFDWYTGTGVNMASFLSTFLSPLNLLYYVIPRDMILQSMSLFLAIKMALMAFTSCFFLNKVFPKLPANFKVLFAVMYAFSGYILQYYTNIMWLETVIIFPILIWTLLLLLNENRVMPYLITYTVCLILSFYLTFMTTLFILFSSGLYIFLMLPKEKRKKCFFNLGIGTFTPFLLSAVVLLPSYLHMTSSARMSNSAGLLSFLNVRLDLFNLPNLNKLLMLLGAELFIVLLFRFACRGKQYKKQRTFFFTLIAMMVIPIFFEGVNLLWHAGSYADFPTRFGFMITFVLICACSYYLTYCYHPVKEERLFLKPVEDIVAEEEQQQEKPKQKSMIKERLSDPLLKKRIWFIIKISLILALICFSIPLLVKIYQSFNKYGIYLLGRNNNELYQTVVMTAVLYMAVIVLGFSLCSKKLRNAVISIAVILPVLFYSAGLIGVDIFASSEHDDKFIEKTLNVKNVLPAEENVLNRIKDTGVQLNTNYPQILERSAISNWTHLIPDYLQDSMKSFGYSTIFTRTLDSGGTVFSDALFGIKNTLSLYEEDSELYRFNQKAGDFNYYDCAYTFPFGLMADQSILKPLAQNICDSQNALYKSISGDTQDIMKRLTRTQDEGTSKILNAQNIQGGKNYQLQVKEKEALYFWSPSSGLTLTINGEPVIIPTLKQPGNLSYYTNFNNKLILLGTFENETISITVKSDKQIIDDNIRFATVSLKKMDALMEKLKNTDTHAQAGNSSLNMTVENGEAGKLLFIPVGYDKGWSCKINGLDTDVLEAAGGFMAVQLTDGVNQIEMNFLPNGLIPGLLISVFSLLGLIGICLLVRRLKRKNLDIPKPVLSIAKYIYSAAFVCAVLIVYIIPIAWCIYKTFY